MTRILAAFGLWLALVLPSFGQDLTIATVTRQPFSLAENERETGFSIDLFAALAEDLDREVKVIRVESFSQMLDMARTGEVDAAVANISITASREAVMDFSQPIFESGLQIMVPDTGSGSFSVFKAVMSRDVILAIALAFALLFGGGMLMWVFERGRQPYFDHPPRQAMFPAFWWALNLMLNGGFEERMPRSPMGRVFGVVLVISSLFFVSVFVAKITAVLTVEAIQSNVSGVNDLYDKRVGTIEGSTAANFLEGRDMRFAALSDLSNLLDAFEAGELDAVVFDAPILAYYVNTNPQAEARVVGSVFMRENYGIALPSGSELAEPLNQSLLKLRENGVYDRIYRKWFGAANG